MSALHVAHQPQYLVRHCSPRMPSRSSPGLAPMLLLRVVAFLKVPFTTHFFCRSMSPTPRDETSVTIGVLADIQYRSDKDDIIRPAPYGHQRSYRSALPKTSQAVAAFSARSVPFVLHLGDIIDGREATADRDVSLPDVLLELDAVLSALSKLPSSTRLLHVVGNHCLYVGRAALLPRLGLSDPAIYAVDMSPRWRAVVLDTMDFSAQRPAGHWLRPQVEGYMLANADKPNAQNWNGGISNAQLMWLRETLAAARSDGKRVVLCGHHPIVPEASSAEHVQWNTENLLKCIEECKDVVMAYFAGHYHPGGYAVVDGVHHVTFEAVLDSDETNAYAFVTFSEDKICLEGFGNRGPKSRELVLSPDASSNTEP